MLWVIFQEPFSTVFSLLNAVAHVAGLAIVRNSRSSAAQMLQACANSKPQIGLVSFATKVALRLPVLNSFGVMDRSFLFKQRPT